MTPLDQSIHFVPKEKSIISENSLKIWPKSQAEALATELPIKKVCNLDPNVFFARKNMYEIYTVIALCVIKLLALKTVFKWTYEKYGQF